MFQATGDFAELQSIQTWSHTASEMMFFYFSISVSLVITVCSTAIIKEDRREIYLVFCSDYMKGFKFLVSISWESFCMLIYIGI